MSQDFTELRSKPDMNAKQDTLVSGTNIKTVNGNSVLGSGDLVVSGAAAWGSITGTLSNQTDLDNALAGKSGTGHNHTGTYEPADVAIQSHVVSSHAPSDAQKNSDITKAEIEAKLIGEISSHTHAGGNQAFPVGSVFIAVVSTNPTTLLGYGTWSAIAAGKMLIGLDSGDTDFDTVEETGGAKTKTIAQANLPNISTGAGTSHNHTQNAHGHLTQRYPTATGSSTGFTIDTSMSGTLADNTLPVKDTIATNQAEAAHTHSLGGSGTALNVMNPYFVVYIWKRTA